MPASIVLHKFANGAKKLQFTDSAQVGIAHDGRVYWATPDGWKFVLAHPEAFREDTYRVLGDATGWPATHDSDFYLRQRTSGPR
ncbi:hypothetical protein [Amycolatopsis sp. NPDC058986]|uniref:hypothetical protein n=1 Tax=Actinomycetes TaxID=1760 RepID=UPI00366B6101